MRQIKKKEKKGRLFSRRELLKTSLTGAAGLAIGSTLGISVVKAERPIKFGLHGVCSGPGGLAGESSLFAMKLWAEEVNRKGGLLGRTVEVVQRDTLGKPEEAVRYTREFAASGDIDFIIAHGSSAEAFGVAAISKDVKKLITSQNQVLEYTADPKVRSRYCFRIAPNALINFIGSGQYVARISKELGLTRWFTVAADYSFGRDTVNFFLEFLKKYSPEAEIVGQVWPKLFEADYSPQITALLAAKPHAVFNALWGGDVISFVKQGSMYGIFEKFKFFFSDLADYYIIDAIVKALGKLPAGMHAKVKYLKIFPDTKANHGFNDAYIKRFGTYPNYWASFIYAGALLIEAAVKKAGTTENEAVIRALDDLSAKVPTGVGPGGTVTMRARDHQLINYADGFGVTIPEEPFLANIVPGSWDKIIEEETIWLKKKGWL